MKRTKEMLKRDTFFFAYIVWTDLQFKQSKLSVPKVDMEVSAFTFLAFLAFTFRTVISRLGVQR